MVENMCRVTKSIHKFPAFPVQFRILVCRIPVAGYEFQHFHINMYLKFTLQSANFGCAELIQHSSKRN